MILNSLFLFLTTLGIGTHRSIGLYNLMTWTASFASDQYSSPEIQVPVQEAPRAIEIQPPAPPLVLVSLSLPTRRLVFGPRRTVGSRVSVGASPSPRLKPKYSNMSNFPEDAEEVVSSESSSESGYDDPEIGDRKPKQVLASRNSSTGPRPTKKPKSKPKKKKKSSKPPILDRFELGCTVFEQVMIDGPYESLDIEENELCISISKIPTCRWYCREQRNVKRKYRFACLDKDEDEDSQNATVTATMKAAMTAAVKRIRDRESGDADSDLLSSSELSYLQQIIFLVNHGTFVDLSKSPHKRKLRKNYPSGCVSVL